MLTARRLQPGWIHTIAVPFDTWCFVPQKLEIDIHTIHLSAFGVVLRAGAVRTQQATQTPMQPTHNITGDPWWRHQMETFSALLAICAANSPVTGEFPAQRPVTRSFDVYFDLRLNERLSKQSWGWWFDTPLCLLWRHNNAWSPFIRPRSRYS